MDIREIQALHAQYSSQPVVIDINSHVRALPAPERQKSARERVTARLSSASRKLGRPAAIVLAVAAGAGLAGISAAKLWHALHPPQAAAHIEQSPAQAAATPPAPAAASTPSSPQRQLTSADFVEPPDRPPATTPRVDTQALRTGGSSASMAPANAATPAAATDLEKAAASPIRAERAASNQAAGQQQAADAQGALQTWPAMSSAPIATRPAVQPAERPKPTSHRIHRAPAHPRQEASNTEAVQTNSEPVKPEHAPKPATSAKTGDVQLF
ncbi:MULTISPECIES: hypothetical protein [Burkholderia cepacia complex]|uniref:Uncharacterized protein n=1 Tax=Burkholderia pseudomultivorans TaxID=1207504 RepID=A0A6P2J1Q4_9BURK|nr:MULTISPECIES: hypothetical protein [Burkholderia cepacia complex]AIO71078.1 hypothetical protein DM80_5842 [Burkholderia multivorans]MBJ9616048.1 hypothetical protein [Burkholderia multivorans]MBU9146165.1 hypothetical protein [Burkholderia multivorans]MBU9203935.1 hypothetical protein [Burkholderia multivorans]MBU9351948.1 hypothetical protein [Burkholderia multivorans]